MEFTKPIVAPVTLKGVNYLLWSRTMKTTLCSRGLWSHVLLDKAPESTAIVEEAQEGQPKDVIDAEAKWFQEDQLVLAILQSSLEASLLSAYSYCENAKELWETLQSVYGNTSNLMRIFEVKQTLSNMRQEGVEFTKHYGEFRALWAELEMLRPDTNDPLVRNERKEEDKVFGLLMTLSSSYKELIQHLLRDDKLPTLEAVCAKIQKEQGSQTLFGNKGDLVSANKSFYKGDDKRSSICAYCKGRGHSKDQCWKLHPHLRPAGPYVPRGRQMNTNRFNYNKGSFGNSNMNQANVASSSSTMPPTIANLGSINVHEKQLQPHQSLEHEYVKRAELDNLIKALKEHSGNVVGKSLQASYHAHTTNKPLIVDSGASHHMISDMNLINNLEPALGNVVIANGTKIPIKGIGNLRLFEKDTKAFYMPSFTSNLLSVKRATTDLNCNVIFGPNEFCFQDIETKMVLGKGGTKDELYVLEDLSSSSLVSCLSSTNVVGNNGSLWHARLGHPHVRALELIFPSITFDNSQCEACILGKHCKSVFPHSSHVYEHCFELIHSDVWTAPCVSREHHKYFVTFIDEKSKYTWITLLPSKDRVLEAFINFQSYVTNQYDAKIKVFRTDNGGEYTSKAFRDHLLKYGILHQTSCPYTPQQNGVAERKNRHLMEVARSMMFHTNVPKIFWGDAVLAACYLINRIPTKVLHDVSPFEVLNLSKPQLNHLKVFGCLCFVLVPGGQRNKLEEKSTKAMFIGYSSTQKGYKCYDPDSRRVFVSRDVKFLEGKPYHSNGTWETIKDISDSASDRASYLRQLLESFDTSQTRHKEPAPPSIPLRTQVQGEPSSSPSSSNSTPASLDHEGENVHEEEPDQVLQPEIQEEAAASLGEDQRVAVEVSPQVLRRSTRIRHDPSNWVNTRVYYNAQAVAHPIQATCSFAHFPEEHQAFISCLDQNQIPKTFEEAMEHEVWRHAVQAEIEAMIRNHTWDESYLPKKKKAVSSKWVFTIKYKSNGEIERYKARLVARGFTQTYGEDFGDTFAPVAKLHTVRIVLSLATNLEWELWQMDVKNAFLQGELEEEVYMRPPPGLEGAIGNGNVLRLRKAIYGLKQSPRAWYHKLSMTLRDRGFRRSEVDHTLFTLPSHSGIIVVLVYVDDIVITGSDKEGIQETKSYLKSQFDIKDLGLMKYFLGIEICRSQEGLFLSQRKYSLDLLNETGMMEAKPISTPIEESYKVINEGETEDQPYENPKLYRRLVGKLIYLTLTRPDLCFAVNQISQHMQTPKIHHWEMLERVLRYLRGTYDHGIWMSCNKSTEIVGYCDADWAGDREDRRSTTGYCTFVGGNLVTWRTKKQKIVSCSSAEAEYRSMRKLTTELIWIKAILKDLEIEVSSPITMHCDNQAAIHIASNSVFHERTKHIEVDCHKVRQAVEQGVILPCYTKSKDQLADVFTKAASTKVCESILPRLGLTSIIP